MNIEKLRSDRDQARKNGDHLRMSVLVGMIDAVQKASMAGKTRVLMTDQLVDEALIKYQKMYQEIIDTCPKNRTDVLNEAISCMEIIKEYAPQLITDKETIVKRVKEIAETASIELSKSNRGVLMKSVSAELKGKADMKIVSAVVGEMLN